MTGVDPDPPIQLTAAALADKPALANLLELYTHDFSEFVDLEIGQDGRFGYPELDLYWTDPHRFPFLVHVNRRLAGFILVHRMAHHESTVWDMVEFFILRGFRGRSVGMRAAHQAFAHFPGNWQVRVMQSNQPACAFWSRAVRTFAGHAARMDRTSTNGREWTVYSFSSPPAG